MKQSGSIICHAFFSVGVVKNGRIQEKNMEWSVQVRRRSATTGLITEALRVLQKTVGVLSEPERGAAMQALGIASRRVASCRTRAASLRFELVIAPCGLVDGTNFEVMSSVQGCQQTRLRPVPAGSSHMPTNPIPYVSQNPRWVGLWQMISARCIGLDAA